MIHNARNEVRNEEGCGASILVAVVLLALGVMAEAQQPKKVPRIGYLSTTIQLLSTRFEAIRLALRGLATSKDRISPSSTDMRRESPIGLPEFVAELVRLKVDIIVVAGGAPRSGRPRMRPRRFPSL